MVRRITAGILLVLCTLAVATGIARIIHESEQRGVIISVPFSDISDVAIAETIDLEALILTLKGVGLHALVVEPTEDERVATILENSDIKAIWEFRFLKDSESLTKISQEYENLSLGSLPKMPFAGLADNLKRLVDLTRNLDQLLILDEFQIPNGLVEILDLSQQQVARLHLLESEERMVMSLNETTQRYKRAVSERKVDILVLPALTSQQIEFDIRALRSELESLGIENEIEKSKSEFSRIPTSGLPLIVIQLLAFLVVVGMPIWGYLYLRKKLIHAAGFWGGFSWLISFSLISVLGSLFAAALLSQSAFFLGLESFRGVKIAMILPLVVIGFIALREIDLLSIKLKDLTLLSIVGIAFIFLLIRSGNESILPVPILEEQIRFFLEQTLVARPRFKEFLIGHPALFIWGALGIYRNRPWAIAILLVGIIGQVSIMNSFVHVHTPLLFTLLRVLNGLWLGLLLGIGAHAAILLVQKILFARRLEISNS
jgi:hypothetical protein